MEEEIQALKDLLKQKDYEVQKAAEFGKSLLEENEYLRSYDESTVKECASKVEKLQQEIYELQRKLETKEQTESWYKDEIIQLRNEQQKRISEVRESVTACNTQTVSKLTRQISELQYELEKSQNSELQLKEKMVELEELSRCKQEQAEVTCKSFIMSDDTAQLQELLDLQNENTVLKSDLICCKTDSQKMKVELEKIEERLKSKDEELEEVQCQCTSYINSLENARMEIMDLKVEMDVLRMEESIHSKKGNSLFSEVEDRRVVAEKKLITQKVQLDALKEKLAFEKQQHQKLKMQMVVLLQMSRGGSDSDYTSKLESKLSTAREEIRNLTQKLGESQDNQKCKTDVLLEFQQKFGDSPSNDYTEYLVTLLKSKEEEIAKLGSDMSFKSIQLLDERNKTSVNEHKLHELQAERDKFHGQNMKLVLQVEELLQKYEPESLENKKTKKMTHKEKIPLPENTVFCLKETTLNKSVIKGDSNYIDHTADQSVSTESKPLEGIDLNREPICPRAMSRTKTSAVKICDSVTVVDTDGHTETTGVSDGIDRKKLERSKPKGRIQKNVKEVVLPNNGPSVNDCKTQ